MIPPSMKYNAEGSTPNFSEADGMIVERGSQVRLRIKGIRGELGQMFAIGSIREDYLGYGACATKKYCEDILTPGVVLCCSSLLSKPGGPTFGMTGCGFNHDDTIKHVDF